MPPYVIDLEEAAHLGRGALLALEDTLNEECRDVV
jgi:hypothetical protein